MLRLALIALLWPAWALGSENERLGDMLPNAAQRGEAMFRWLGLPLYRARLYTGWGKAFTWSDDFALELTYVRRLSGATLVNSTISEFERLGASADPALRDQLAGCFARVDRGDRYLAITSGPNAITFLRNGQQTCTLERSGIKRDFMAIFLGDNTRSAAFTARLRGG